MSKGVYAALSGAIASERALDVTAQNLANSSSGGYQRIQPIFREVLERTAAGAAQKGPSPGSHFAAVAGTVIDTTVGVIRSTQRPLDVALPENAFIAVKTTKGERYTRAGALAVDSNGLVSAAGVPVLDDQDETIAVRPDATDLAVTRDGQIVAGTESIGRLKIVTFGSSSQLSPEGGTLYASSSASGNAQPAEANLQVGALEESNASPIDSMTELVKANRSFDAYQRAIDAFRDADRRIVTVPGV